MIIGILCGCGFTVRHYMKGSDMLRVVALLFCLLLAISQHNANAEFKERLSDLLRGPSRHLRSVDNARRERTKRASSEDYLGNIAGAFNEDPGGATNGSSLLNNCTTTDKQYQLDDIFRRSYTGPVCNIIEVRNTADQLKDLENCTIVNGFVHIVFMHNLSEADLMKYRFPKLRVITHYLLIYRVFKLKTLRHMFPNLAVIGGLETFRGYSLVLFENFHLTEIGLKNLHFILRGNVRIEKNPSLCYIETIDWKKLGGNGNKNIEVFRANNRERTECVDQCGKESSCEIAATGDRQFCWGLDACQLRNCPANCPDACDSDLKCNCHEQCLSGCTRANDPTACIACRDKYFNNTCLNKCPPGKYLIHGWLCIEAEECKKLEWHFFDGKCILMCPSGYTVNVTDCRRECVKCDGDCGQDCLGNYVVDTLSSLHFVEGCRSIEGSLTIQIGAKSEVVDRLDSTFKDLESVGTLIVRKAYPLVTLSFLKNLRRITGNNMDSEVYSVYFLENPSLKELWNITERNLQIDKGKAFFHFNSKLCINKIKEIIRITPEQEDDTDVSTVTNGDKATCEMVPIVLREPQVYPHKPFVIVSWENYIPNDDRTLIGYQVHYKESPEKNAKQYDGVDACRVSSWTVIEAIKSKEKSFGLFPTDDSIFYNDSYDDYEDNENVTSKVTTSNMLVSKLKAYTQYAYYIRASTTSRAGAVSKIDYFRTRPSDPSKPFNAKAQAVNSSSILVMWSPPQLPNGIITHYIIEWQRQPEEDIPNVRKINTCERGFNQQRKPSFRPTSPTTKPAVDVPEEKQIECPKCECGERESLEKEKIKAKESSEFENFLQDHLFPSEEQMMMELMFLQGLGDENDENEVLVNGEQPSRKKRSLYERPQNSSAFRNDSINPVTSSTSLTKPPNSPGTMTAPKVAKEYPMYRMIVSSNNATLTNLHHFAEYGIHIYACNHASNPSSKTDLSFDMNNDSNYYEGNHSYTRCSIEALIMRRTEWEKESDKIPQESISAVFEKEGLNEGKIGLSWKMPLEPNAYIRNFDMKIQSLDNENPYHDTPYTECIHVNKTADELGFVSHTPSAAIPSGTYHVKLQPVSLGGKGVWSDPVEFTVTDLRSRTQSSQIIIISVVCLSIVIIAIVIASLLYVRHKQKAAEASNVYADHNPEYMPYVYIPDDYEIDAEQVQILNEIGHGNFGKVFAGIAQNIVKDQEETKVAVKKLHENAMPARRFEFLKEASLMKSFNAYHVVRLLGVVSRTADPLVIMEFMARGDLKSYLRSRREDAEANSSQLPPPVLQEKLQMAAEIADGMAYLAAYKFVHRDLAARNCLVDENGTVKIGDFGLARDVYETDYYRKESRGFLPIRWMAPESLKDGVFDSSSDVWSYGVVLWELATLAEQPYQGKQHDEVTRFVIDGGYMEKPKNCPKKLYDLMAACWQFNPNMRPEFLEIVHLLYVDVDEEFKEVCFYGKDEQACEDQYWPGQNHSDGTDASYPYADLSTSPLVSHIGSNGGPASRHGDYCHSKNTNKQSSVNPSVPNDVEMQCLLPHDHYPEMDGLTYEDAGSLLTTSTTATRTPSFGNSNSRKNGYGSGSSYDTDEDDGSIPPDGYVSARDSGTFVNRGSDSRGRKRSIGCRRVTGDQDISKHIDCDLESGLDEGMWGNSTSHSSASTPTDMNSLLPIESQLDGHILMHATSSNC